jgi:HEPN domain-containing protein
MSNKQPTAVEWLYNELFYFLNAKSKFEDSDQILDKAKEMEKQQIMDAYWDGCGNWDNEKKAEDYYNETYGGNK